MPQLFGLLLDEREVGQVRELVTERDHELSARVGPRLVSLPHVGLGVGDGIVGEAARASRYGLL